METPIALEHVARLAAADRDREAARSPGWLRSFATPFVLLQGVPPVILAVLLLFVALTITGLWVLYLAIHWLFTAAAG